MVSSSCPALYLSVLTYFGNRIAWIKPDSALLAAVSGTHTGLGLNPLPTFDWK